MSTAVPPFTPTDRGCARTAPPICMLSRPCALRGDRWDSRGCFPAALLRAGGGGSDGGRGGLNGLPAASWASLSPLSSTMSLSSVCVGFTGPGASSSVVDDSSELLSDSSSLDDA